MFIREATLHDIPQIQIVRNSVRENRLSNPALVSDKDCEAYLFNRGKGWVCEQDARIVGFAIVDMKEHNIWALFVTPAFEKRGIGKRLHATMLNWYFNQTKDTVWLGTAPDTRAETFYRRQGWTNAGLHVREIRFEMTFKQWQSISDNSRFF